MYDAATAGGSSPSPCMDGFYSGFMLNSYEWRLYSNIPSVCGPGFGKDACEIDPVARGVWLG